tara:strand:+ start:317 stop:574 length:258 start_codon:yes stop_codon:yes gene_type:complete
MNIGKIKHIVISSHAAPTQIDGEMENGDIFYIRYRNCRYYAEVNGKQLVRQDIDADGYIDEVSMEISYAMGIFWESYYKLKGVKQ